MATRYIEGLACSFGNSPSSSGFVWTNCCFPPAVLSARIPFRIGHAGPTLFTNQDCLDVWLSPSGLRFRLELDDDYQACRELLEAVESGRYRGSSISADVSTVADTDRNGDACWLVTRCDRIRDISIGERAAGPGCWVKATDRPMSGTVLRNPYVETQSTALRPAGQRSARPQHSATGRRGRSRRRGMRVPAMPYSSLSSAAALARLGLSVSQLMSGEAVPRQFFQRLQAERFERFHGRPAARQMERAWRQAERRAKSELCRDPLTT